MGMLFFSGFLNIVWEYIEIDFRWKFARRDFLKKRPQQIIFCWRFSKPFFWWTVRLPLAKDAKVSINRLIDYGFNFFFFSFRGLINLRKFPKSLLSIPAYISLLSTYWLCLGIPQKNDHLWERTEKSLVGKKPWFC